MEGIGVVVTLAVGVVFVVLLLWVFVRRDGWGDVDEAVDSVQHAHLRRVAEAGISSLAPGAIRLAERERGTDGNPRVGTAPVREFWRRFAAASASVESDPAAALGELRGLPALLQEALGETVPETAAAEEASRREDGR